MAEQTTVEVVIHALTDAAEEAIQDVGSKLNGMTMDAEPAQEAMDEVGDEMDSVTASGMGTQEALDEVADEANSAAVSQSRLANETEEAGDKMSTTAAQAGVLSGAYSRVSASAGGLTVSTGALSTAMTASLIPAVATLSTALLPLVGIMGAVAAGAVSLAGAFGGFLAVGAVTHMEELKTAFQEVKPAIKEAIQPLGDAFGPLLVDAVRALPELTRAIVEAIGPVDEFKQAMVELGQQAMRVIPQIVGGMFDLATIALPVLMDFVDFLVNEVGPAIGTVIETTRRFAPAFRTLGSAIGDILPDLYELGETVLSLVIPAMTNVINVVGDVVSWVNSLDNQLHRLAVAAAITAPAIFSVAGSIGALLGPVGIAAGAVAAFAAAYRSNFMGVRDVTQDVVGQVVDYVMQFKDDVIRLKNQAGQAFRSLAGTLRSTIRPLVGPLKSLGDNVRGLVEDFLAFGSEVASGVSGPLGRIVSTINENKGAIQDLATTLISAANDVVGFYRGTVLPAMRFVFQNFLLPLIREVARLWAVHFGDIVTETTETINAIRGYIQSFGQWFNSFWSKHGKTIKQAVKFVFDAIVVIVSTSLDIVMTTIRTIMNIIQGDFDEALGAIKGLFLRTFNRVDDLIKDWGLIQSLQNVIDNVTSTVSTFIMRDLPGFFIVGLSMVIGQVESWGATLRNIFASIYNGILSLATSAVDSLINSTIDALNQFLSTLDDVSDAVSEIPGVDTPDIGSLEQASIDTKSFEMKNKETSAQTLSRENAREMAASLNLKVEGDGPLAEFVKQKGEVQQEQRDRAASRRVRRQGAGGG